MRVVVLTTPDPNQAALVHRLTRVVDVVGVVLSANVPRTRRHRPGLLANRIASRSVGHPFRQAWASMLARYEREHGDFPEGIQRVEVDNVNDAAARALVDETAPDLVAVSGTNIVGRPLIDAANERRGMVNLHTGISPYVKGGPNCTNWCLARGWFHLIGNTVMWIDPGVDSGNLIATETTPLDGAESLDELHWKVMEHAHDLYVRSIGAIGRGDQVPSIPQAALEPGATFVNADWSALEMLRARRNFARHYRAAIERGASQELALVSLSGGDGPPR